MILPENPAGVNTPGYTSHPTLSPIRSIEVLSIEPGQAPGVVAIVAVRVGGIVLRGVRVCNRGRGTFINFPSRKIDGAWLDLVEIVSPALHNAIAEVILSAVRMMGGER